MLYGFEGTEPVRNSEVLESDCAVLITAAAERQVNAQNAARIQTSLVLEAVDNAITPAAASILASHDVNVIPALLGTAPRLLAWFVECQQGLHCSMPEQDATESLVRHKLAGIFRQVQSLASARKLPLPCATRRLSLEKFAAILRLTN